MGKFNFLVCGGTFDLLHKGHKDFINNALKLADKVLIGITSNSYIKSFKKEIEAEDFKIRKKAVEDYLVSINAYDRAQIVSIDSAYEPYLETSTDYDAIAVTEKVREVAEKINVLRRKNGIAEFKILNIPIMFAEDGLEISSSRIRNGEIDRNGRLYLNPVWQKKTLVLPNRLRSFLQSPWGEVLKEVPKKLNGLKTVVVGDITAQKFNQQNINQFLSIIDFLVERKARFKNLSELGFNAENVQRVTNPPGKITPELFQAIKKAFETKEKQIILVEGEEDLAVLPVLLIASLNFSIFYGQPNQGLVWVRATEDIKEKAYNLIQKFNLD